MCESNLDCETGTCDVVAHVCVSEQIPSTSLLVGIEVVSPSGSSQRTTTFPNQVIEGPQEIDFALPARVDVGGTVRWQTTVVPAEITFERQARFDGGGTRRVTAQTSAANQVDLGFEADYAAALEQGATYHVTVQPTGTSRAGLPPLHFDDVTIPADVSIWQYDIAYPEEFTILTGAVLTMSDTNQEQSPIGSVSVRAVDPLGDVISSVGTTDQATGQFVIQMLPDADDQFLIRLSASADRPFFPTIEVSADYFFPGEVPQLLVPSFTHFEYTAMVEDADSIPVAGAVVTLQSSNIFDTSTGITGSFKTTATTDQAGTFTVNLLPGTYWVLVAAPEGSIDGMMVVDRTISGPAMGQVFSLPRRPTLSGTVMSSQGTPIASATIKADPVNPIPLTGISDVVSYGRSNSTVSDGEGLFAMPLDSAVYDVVVQAPASSGFPWVVAPNLSIGEDGLEKVLTAQSPIVISGRLLSELQEPIGSAELRAYAILESGESYRSLLIGRTTSDEEGNYTLLLPPSL